MQSGLLGLRVVFVCVCVWLFFHLSYWQTLLLLLFLSWGRVNYIPSFLSLSTQAGLWLLMLCRAWCGHLPQCFPHHHTSSLLCILSFGEKSDCFPIYPDYLSRPDLFSLPVVLVFLGAMTLVYSKERALSEPSTIYLEERFLFRRKTVKRKQILRTVNHSVSLYLELTYRPMQDQLFWFFF